MTARYWANVTVPANVQCWQSVCFACNSRVVVMFVEQPDLKGKPPFRYCCLCGSGAVFHRLDDSLDGG